MKERTGRKAQNSIIKSKVITRERHELHWDACFVLRGLWNMNCMELPEVYGVWYEVHECKKWYGI